MNTRSDIALRAAALDLFHARMRKGDALSVTGCMLFVAMAWVPTMAYTGITGRYRGGGDPWWVCLSAITGALFFFCLWYPERRYWYYGIASGITTGLAMVWGSIVCYRGRTHISELDAFAPLAIAFVPAWLTWYLPLRHRVVNDIAESLWRQHTNSATRAAKPGK